ncbi:MAG: hypothetical protein KDA91_04765 [Planctomycetaceae bacterium]|nr:hypothetical protein [Planctomycetaceae bacterium]
MIRARFTCALVASTLALAGMFGTAHGQTLLSGDQVLPKDTYIYVAVPSVERMKQGFNASSTGQMIADPAFDDFKAELKSAFSSEVNEAFANVQDTLGLTVEELLEIPSGEFSFAISSVGNNIGIVLIADYGDHESQVTGLLEKAQAGLSQAPNLELNPTTIDGTEVTMYTVTGKAAQATPLAKEFGWFQKDGRLVFCTNSAIMDSILTNWTSGEDGLRSNNVFSYVMEKCHSDDDKNMVVAFVDPLGLATKVIQSGSLGPQITPQASMGLMMLPAFGLNQLKGFGSVGQMNVDGFEAVSRSFIYSEQPPQALMRVFMLDEVNPAPPAWVKEGTSAYLSTKWNITEAYAAIESLVDGFQGAGALAGMIDGLATQGPQIHIKTDVIDQLDGTVQFVSAPGEEAGNDQMLFSLGVRDNAAMTDLLTRLTSEPGFPGESREFQGVTLYEISATGDKPVTFTVANNHLMIGVGGTMVEQALRNDTDTPSLAEAADYRKISEHFKPGAVAVSYSHPAAQYRSLYEMLKSGSAADQFPGMDEIFERIDFTRLPPFEAIEKYLAPAGGYWVGDENGVLMEQFSLKPGN